MNNFVLNLFCELQSFFCLPGKRSIKAIENAIKHRILLALWKKRIFLQFI